jgi:hypothetical protein
MSGKDNKSDQISNAAAAGATAATPGTEVPQVAAAAAASSAGAADLKGKLAPSFAAATPLITVVRTVIDHRSDIVEAKNFAVTHPARAAHAGYQGTTDGVIDSALSGFGIIPSINILPNDKPEAVGGKGTAPSAIADAGAGLRQESHLKALVSVVPVLSLVDKSTNEKLRQTVKDIKDETGELAGIRKFEPRNETEAHVLGTVHAAAQTAADLVGSSLVGFDLTSGALEKTGEAMAKVAQIGKAAETAEKATMRSTVLANAGKAAERGEKIAQAAREYIESNSYKTADSTNEIIKGGDEGKQEFRLRRTVTGADDTGLVKPPTAMDERPPLDAEFKKVAENIRPSQASLKDPAIGPVTVYKSPTIPI